MTSCPEISEQKRKHKQDYNSAFNIRVVSGRVASPGEVLVVVLVVLVVAFFLIVSVVALPLLLLLLRKPPTGPPKSPPGPQNEKQNGTQNEKQRLVTTLVVCVYVSVSASMAVCPSVWVAAVATKAKTSGSIESAAPANEVGVSARAEADGKVTAHQSKWFK